MTKSIVAIGNHNGGSTAYLLISKQFCTLQNSDNAAPQLKCSLKFALCVRMRISFLPFAHFQSSLRIHIDTTYTLSFLIYAFSPLHGQLFTGRNVALAPTQIGRQFLASSLAALYHIICALSLRRMCVCVVYSIIIIILRGERTHYLSAFCCCNLTSQLLSPANVAPEHAPAIWTQGGVEFATSLQS